MKRHLKNIKRLIVFSLVILSVQGMAFGLEFGDEVSVEAIGKASFIQGVAPGKWEEGKVYVLECWATWCGPCVAAIPHMDGLYDKYRAKGLVVIGMNVLEDGKDKVAKFVEKKGEGMSYPVAYVGRGGAFEETWFKAAGLTGIPYTFVVKDGKLLFVTHPQRLTSRMIEVLLNGGGEADAVAARMKRAAENKEVKKQHMRAFRKAAEAANVVAMEAAMAEVDKLDPEDVSLKGMAIEIVLTKRAWDEAKTLLEEEEELMAEAMMWRVVVPKIDEQKGVSPGLLNFLVERLRSAKSESGKKKIVAGRLLIKLGKQDEALLVAQAGLEELKESGKYPLEPFEAYVKSIEDGEPQTMEEIDMALREAMRKAGRKPPQGE